MAKDLANSWAVSHLFEGLFYMDTNGDISPLLADNYTINSTGTEYIFSLKDSVYFHKNDCFKLSANSTRKMIANDVIYSFQRLVNSNTASPGAWVLRSKLDSVQPFEIIDDLHLKIRLQKPCAQFISILTMPYCSIVPEEAIKYYGKKFRNHPVGTGPFQFKSWHESTALFLNRNPNYHILDKQGSRLPYIDYLKISFNEQKKTEFLSFKEGDLSFITGLDQSIIKEVFTTNGELNSYWRTKIHCYKMPFLNTEYIAILQDTSLLTAKSPFHSKKIRQAINYGINRNEIVSYLKSNLVSPANKGFVSKGMPNYDESFSGYSYQPLKAVSLLKQAGYNQTLRPKIELHINNSLVEIAEFIHNQLETIGFEVDIKLHPADIMMQLASKGNIEFFRRSWVADYPDAENFLACFYSKNSTPPNYTRFCNNEFDRLYELCTVEPNIEIRKQYYKKMERILLEEAPIVPIFYDQSIRLVQPNIQGLKQNTLNVLDLKYVKIN